MDFDLAAPEPVAPEPAPPPTTAPPAPESESSATATEGVGGSVDMAKALALFGHYADEGGSSADEQAIGAPVSPPSPGVTCGSSGVEAQSGADAYSGQSLQPTDFAEALKDPAFKTDPYAAIQRANARRQLSGKLSVVDDDFVGPRLPNQVSQEQFDKMAEVYSNIQMGRGDLTVNTDEMCPEDAIKYRADLMNDIGTMMQTETGRQELAVLGNNVNPTASSGHRHTTIRRLHTDANHDDDLSNDESAPIDAEHAITEPDNRANAQLKPDGHDSGGTDTTIYFNPGVTLRNGASTPQGRSIEGRSDVVLAHEMAHAMHTTEGTIAPGATTNGRYFKKPNAELQAIGADRWAGNQVTENAYRGERNLIGGANANGALPDDATMPQRGY